MGFDYSFEITDKTKGETRAIGYQRLIEIYDLGDDKDPRTGRKWKLGGAPQAQQLKDLMEKALGPNVSIAVKFNGNLVF